MQYPSSNRWQPSTKQMALGAILILFVLFIYLIRWLIIPILMSMVMAYVLLPAVDLLHKRLRLPRLLAIGLVYVLLIGFLVAIPAGTVPGLISQANAFIRNVPSYLEQGVLLAQDPVVVMEQELVPAEVVPVERVVAFVVQYMPSVGLQSVNLFGSLASATISTLGWIVVVLFLSFYMVKDHDMLFKGLIRVVPAEYQAEITELGYELGEVWNSFLRGQLILFAIMGTTVFVLATIIGLPNALLLGLISGFVEFIPQIGATLGMIPAVLIAIAQHDQSWLGAQMSPFLFGLLVMAGYIVLQQIENYFLVPRVIGRSLNMHPMIVFIAALAGAGLAGVLGILLASPVLASVRAIFNYVYAKLLDKPPFPPLMSLPAEPIPPPVAPHTAAPHPENNTADQLPIPH
ncbi:MAG: AI-2E family transporter [Chloroflexi bacterium]|nr:AI-2E family transporter [Chloroflexota bacterium]MDA0242212.1 AI-2E family transporter [Chloroflexota bacterium]